MNRNGDTTDIEGLCYSNHLELMSGKAVRIGDYVYGTDGAFGPSFLIGVQVEAGEIARQQRGFGRSSLVYAADKAVIVDENGRLILATLSSTGAEVLAEAEIFDTVAWTAPTLAGTTPYARDRARIVACDQGE